MDVNQGQISMVSPAHAQKIEAFDSNAPACWTFLKFKPKEAAPTYVIDISTLKFDEQSARLPISLSHSHPQFITSTLEITKDNKMSILENNFKKCQCDDINALLKTYMVINLEINYISGMEYEIIGFKSGEKMVGNHEFMEILQEQFGRVKQCWSDFDGRYSRSFANKKNTNQCKMCDVLPFFQISIETILAPSDVSQIGFSQKNLLNKKIPLLFSLNQEVDSEQISTKIKQIVEEQIKIQKMEQKQINIFPIIRAVKGVPSKIFNPHIFAKPVHKNNFEFITIKGLYEYYHYGDQNFTDNGWGCAYRALQTLLSWLNMQGHLQSLSEGMITIRDIQNRLDMIDRSRKLKGSSEWIGATEISWLVPKMTKNSVNCKILHVSDGKKILEKCEELKQHFLTSGCPIMYGGGQYAYSIVGMYYNWKLGECDFLILDPHYTGQDDYGKILEKKGLAWRKPEQMFKKGVFYNFCLPIVN